MRQSSVFPFQCLIAAATCIATAGTSAQGPEIAAFRSRVDRVTVAATVRDSQGRPMTGLEAQDFELFDNGQPRPVIGVWSEPGPASVAILMDASGSMATKMALAREAAGTLVAGMKPGFDEVAFYAFDTALRELRPFSKEFSRSDGPLDTTNAYGATSLWDAIASTAGRIANRQQRRALVVITDGVDSASRMKPSDVSGIASELDVPVYMLVIAFSSADEGRGTLAPQGPLADLAAWTGGNALLVQDTIGAASTTRQILTDLQHQYMIAFEPGGATGWHPLVLRARRAGLFVRARSGFMVR